MTTKSTFSEYALYIQDTVKASCSLAEIFKSKGDLKSARELLDGVAEILDRLTYLDDRRRNLGNDKNSLSQPHLVARRVAENPEAKDPPHGAVRKG